MQGVSVQDRCLTALVATRAQAVISAFVLIVRHWPAQAMTSNVEMSSSVPLYRLTAVRTAWGGRGSRRRESSSSSCDSSSGSRA